MPMRRIYLLVQNDVRTGPFTLEELLKQPLHATALVWVIGQSEDWLSPVEIPSLQSYYSLHSDGSISVHETVLADIQSNRFTEPLEFSITENQRIGALDTQLLEPSGHSNFISPGSQIKEEAVSEPQVVSVPGAVSTESIQSIKKDTKTNKEPAAEKEDDNSAIARKNWAVVGIVLLLIVFITWNALFNDGPRIKRNMEYAASAPVVNTAQTPTIQANADNETAPAEAFTDPAPIMEEEASVVVPGYAAHQEPSASTDAFLDSVQRVLDSQEQLMANVDDIYRKSFHYRKRYNKPALSNRRTMPAITNKSQQKQSMVANSTKGTTSKVPLSQQVDLQSRLIMDRNRQQVNTVEVVVKNNSKEVIKSVSVDVFYYKKGEKLLNKETVYFSNLYPKQSITKSIVGNQRATSARFQLGVVSAN